MVESLLTEKNTTIDGYIFWACFETNRKVALALNQQENTGRLDQITVERDKLYYDNPNGVKLSELRHLALCSEMAVLAKFCLQEAGVESALVSGDVMEDIEKFNFGAHTYLVINPGKEDCYVFDVSDPVPATESGVKFYFPRLLKPVVPISYELLNQPGSRLGQLIKCKEILFGDEKYFGVANEKLAYSGDAKPIIIQERP